MQIELKHNPLISIIIPVYNSGKYLHRCIDSVLSQDYSNIEILLVDDGSSDDSPEICEQYAIIDKRIVVIHIPNSGASLARKKGMELAKGEYLSFVDSDDFVCNTYISDMYRALCDFNTNIACCNFQIIINSNKNINCFKSNAYVLEYDKLMYRFFYYEFWSLCGTLYKKEVLNNLEFPKATLSEDYLIKAQIFIKEKNVAYIPSQLYVYEKHEGSLSNTKLSLRAFEEFDNVLKVYNIVSDKIPEYKDLALKNVIETSVKLMLLGTFSERTKYKEEYKPIISFLKTTTLEIFRNKYSFKRTKLIALSLRYCPSLSYFYNFIIC